MTQHDLRALGEVLIDAEGLAEGLADDLASALASARALALADDLASALASALTARDRADAIDLALARARDRADAIAIALARARASASARGHDLVRGFALLHGHARARGHLRPLARALARVHAEYLAQTTGDGIKDNAVSRVRAWRPAGRHSVRATEWATQVLPRGHRPHYRELYRSELTELAQGAHPRRAQAGYTFQVLLRVLSLRHTLRASVPAARQGIR